MEKLTYELRDSHEARATAHSIADERENTTLKARTAKLLRVLTVPPLMAFMLVTTLYAALGSEAFRTPLRYIEAVFALALLPVIPYGLCATIPAMRKRGRKLERDLGIVFSLLGYFMGLLFALLGNGTTIEKELYITYMISGALMGLLSFVFRFKASGHACGASGPFAMLACRVGWGWLAGFALLVPIYVSSIRLGRHKLSELFAGAAVSVGALMIAIRIVALFC